MCMNCFMHKKNVWIRCSVLLCILFFSANAILERKPSLLTPPGGKSEIQLVKGEDLNLECIAEGLWVIIYLNVLELLY